MQYQEGQLVYYTEIDGLFIIKKAFQGDYTISNGVCTVVTTAFHLILYN